MSVRFGVDTETYYDGVHKGLRSIQIAGEGVRQVFIADDYTADDEQVRRSICYQFFRFLEGLNEDIHLDYFNLRFDLSQMMQWLIKYSPYRFDYDTPIWAIKKGTITILEQPQRLYSCDMRLLNGRRVYMRDLSLVLTPGSLDFHCRAWLGRGKVAIESKIFPKSAPEGVDLEYSIEDAVLTYELGGVLRKEGVILNTKTLTTAGRTLTHFRDTLKRRYGMKFDEFFFPGLSKEEIEEARARFERELRTFLRGGVTMALQRGVFHHCTHIDACSMYPTQCVKPWIPYGPILDDEPEGPHFTFNYPICRLELKDGKIPYLQWRSHRQCERYRYLTEYTPGDYVHDAILDGSYGFWEEEWEIIKECYRVIDEGEPIKKYFRALENVALRDYVRELYRGKSENTGAKRLFYKILLNSLYGKFLSRPDHDSIRIIDGERVTVHDDTGRTYYLPLGSWIAMSGRVTLFRAMLSLPKEDVLYCDTDSIIFKGDRFPDVHIGKDLGDWGIEYQDVSVSIIGPKTYQEMTADGRVITKCAGMDAKVKNSLAFGELKEGMEVTVHKAMRDPQTHALNVESRKFFVNSRANLWKR